MNGLKLKRPLVCLDCETTGLDTENDRIVQIAVSIVKPHGGAHVDESKRLLNPGFPIPAAATEVHGITDEMVKDEPAFSAIAQSLAQLLTDVDYAGYNVTFDLQMLMAEFERVGDNADFMEGASIVDAKRLWEVLCPRHLVDAVRFWTGDEPSDDAHDALADVRMTLAVLNGQIDVMNGERAVSIDQEITIPEVPEITPEALHELCFPGMMDLAGKFVLDDEGKHAIWNFGKYRGQAVDPNASDQVGLLKWMLGQDFSSNTKRAVASLLDEMA